MSRRLTEGNVWKQILLFSLPIMAGQLLQQLYNTVDGIVVGNFVSSNALAAVGSCGTIGVVFTALAMGLSGGCGIVISQLFGAEQHDDMRKAVSTSLIMLTATGLAFGLLSFFGAGFIVRVILAIKDPEIANQAEVYVRLYAIGVAFQFVYNAVSSILRSVGDSKASLYFLLVSTVANTIMDLVFVAVLNWGVAGAAAATSIAQIACTVVSWIYMSKHYECFRFRWNELVFDRKKFSVCLKMGIPATLQRVVSSFGNVMMQRLVNSFGAVTMAAYTVGYRFDHYACVAPHGLMQAMSSFAGQNTGAGKPERIKRGVVASVVMSEVFVVVMCIFLYAFTAPLTALFGVEGETQQQAIDYIRFVCFCMPLLALYQPLSGVFQGCGEPEYSTYGAILSLVGKVAGGYVLAYVFDFGYASCWECSCVGWGLAAIFSVLHFRTGKWKNKSIANMT